MSVDDIENLRINQKVFLLFKIDEIQSREQVTVKCINDHKKLVGVIDSEYNYSEHPPRLIQLKHLK